MNFSVHGRLLNQSLLVLKLNRAKKCHWWLGERNRRQRYTLLKVQTRSRLKILRSKPKIQLPNHWYHAQRLHYFFLSSRFIVIPNLELRSIKNPKIYWNSLTSFEISCSRALDLLELDTVNLHIGFKAISIASGNVTMNVNIPFSSFTSTLITSCKEFFFFLRPKFFHNYVDVTISTHFIYCFCFYNLTCVLTIF